MPDTASGLELESHNPREIQIPYAQFCLPSVSSTTVARCLAPLTCGTVYWMPGRRHGVLVRVTTSKEVEYSNDDDRRIICKGTGHTGEGSNSRGAVITQILGSVLQGRWPLKDPFVESPAHPRDLAGSSAGASQRLDRICQLYLN